MRSSRPLNDIHDPLIKADLFSETVGGGTNAAAALGNGALTVGVSPWGELVYLRWPTPSRYDHLRYVTASRGFLRGYSVKDMRHGSGAPCRDWEKYGRPLEKYRGLGAKAGVRLKSGELFWMDDPVWDSSRRYDPEGSHVLITTLQRNENVKGRAAALVVRQWVMPEKDLLVQTFQVDAAEETARFFYHATFAPSQMAENGISNRDSRKAGFSSVYCPDEELLFWFSHEGRKPGRLLRRRGERMTSALLDEIFPEGGVFIALGSPQRIHQVQVGADRAGRVRRAGTPPGAREDAKDGALEGNLLHVGPIDAGVRIDLRESGGDAGILISVAGSARGAAAIIRDAREAGSRRLEEQANAFWEPVAQKILVPKAARAVEKRVARRSVLNLLIGHDRKTGAFVASPSRQPRYCYDWPRDGAFYDMALDLAGLSDRVNAHLDFYRRTQRGSSLAFSPTWLINLRSPLFCPRGHWYSNMNTDGSPGFFRLVPVEIDETSLLVWDLWRHERYVPDEEKEAYRQTYQGMLLSATEAILRFVDLKRGWTRKVMEDDDPRIKATLHGASAVLTALASATNLGREWRLEEETVSRWQRAAETLRAGILKRIREQKVLREAGWRGLPWSLFPAPLFHDYEHPDAGRVIQRLARDMEDKISMRSRGIGYLGEQLFALAVSTQGLSSYQDLKERALKTLTEHVPVEGSDCYGEVGLWRKVRGTDDYFIQNRTSIPHLWSGVTAYLAVQAVYEPEKVLELRPPVPS